jgi:hypothetical protein
MGLHTLRELMENGVDGRKAAEAAARKQGMRVSGGMFGPNRVINERIAFYGLAAIVVDTPEPDPAADPASAE